MAASRRVTLETLTGSLVAIAETIAPENRYSAWR